MKTLTVPIKWVTLSDRCHLVALAIRKQNVGREGDEYEEFEVRLAQRPMDECSVLLAGPYYRRSTVEAAFAYCHSVFAAFVRDGLPTDPVQP